MPQRIEILTFKDVQLLDVAGPLQVFATANDLAVQNGLKPPYEPIAVGYGERIKTSSGLHLHIDGPPKDDISLDTLIIPGGWGVDKACEDKELLEWIRQRSQKARRTVSVCSGAFLLAQVGLLDGRRAATHWARCGEFAQRFSNVKLEADPIFTRDEEIWTSAGVTSGIDLSLALVEDDLGHDKALAVARQLVVFLKRPGGQSQFSAALTLQDSGGQFDELHTWVQQNLHRPLPLSKLAEHTRMSDRSFSRHYQKATGKTPAKAIKEIRLETARRLLEQGLQINRVALRCGFGSEETMRRAFLSHFGIAPRDYRERFAS
ncbi:MAG: GlxA family transcriptional regulator [Sphingomonadales bacterium]|jgi:transcriptional regulator GlxA family with amidase domain